MDKKKFILLGILIFLVVVLGLWFVMATLTSVELVAPPQDGNFSGEYGFNATITEGDEATNVTFYWWNETGSSWKLLCYNDSSGTGPFTGYYDTSILPDGTGYVFNVTAVNGTVTETDNNTGITLDNTAPVITIALPSAGWKKGTINIHANATDATTNVTNSTMYFWFGNSTGNFSITPFTSCPYVSNATGFNCSATFDTSNLADDNYTLWVNASDTMGTPNIKNQSKTLIGVDNTNPTISLSKLSSTRSSITVSFSCPDTLSGSKSCTLSSSSGTVSSSIISGLNCGTSYTVTVTAEDNTGNSATSSESFSTSSCGGGTSPTYEWSLQKSHSWSKITPGVVAIMKDFDNEI